MRVESQERIVVATAQQRRAIGRVTTAVSLGVIALLTLMPGVKRSTFGHLCVICGIRGGVDAVLNVLLFVPLGAGLALLGLRNRRAMAIVCGSTLLVETLQLVAIPGRDATVGDLVANSLGGAIGIVVATHLDLLALPAAGVARRLALGWLVGWIALQSVSAYALTTRPPQPPYFGQLRIFPEETLVFPGHLLAASIGPVALSDGGLTTGERLHDLLAARDPASTVVTATAPTWFPEGQASIVRVGALNDRTVVSMEQSGRDLIFGVRTGADVLRLRRYAFRLRDAFPASPSAADTVHLRGRYGREGAELRAAAGDRVREMHLEPRLADSWRLIAPFPVYLTHDTIDDVGAFLFVSVLLLPIGYWGGRFLRDAAARLAAIGTAAGALVIGFVAVPALFGVGAEPLISWAAAASGMALGALLAPRTPA